MIYGLNFGGPAIPDTKRTVWRKFKRTRRIDGVVYHLAGVGQSESERDHMVITATNGTRKIHVEPVQTAAGVWYGIYVY
jgi:hypothetical protein